MLVVEGPDGSGKTTLAHVLANDMGREYRRSPSLSSREGGNRAHVDWWREQLWGDEAHRMGGVYDRSLLVSEPIYTPVMNRSPLVQAGEYIEMLTRFVSCFPLIIFCLPPWEQQKENLEDKASEQLKGLTIKRAALVLWGYYIGQEYWRYLEELGKLRVLTYDWSNMHEVQMGVQSYLTDEANRVGQRA
jgi:adenylate kinase family enzyme